MNQWITSLVIMMSLTSSTAFSATNTPAAGAPKPTNTATGNNNNGGNMNGAPTSTATGNNNNGNNMNGSPTSTATGNNMNGNNNGNNGGNKGGNNQNMPAVTPAQCTAIAAKLTPVGNACVKIATFAARSSCFNDAPGKAGVDNNQLNACMNSNNAALNSLKANIQAQEKKLYPTQASAIDNHGGNNGGGNNGGNNQNMPAVTPAQCTAITTKLAPQGQTCLKVADYQSRVLCFNNASGKAGVDQGQMNACGQKGALDQLKNSIQAQEHKLYPNQASAMDNHGGNNSGNNNGGNSGPNGGGNNNGGNQQVAPWPAAQCAPLIPKLRGIADGCLKIKDFQTRNTCFKGADSQFPPGFFNGGCQQALDPLKGEYQGKEHSLYPDQPSALN